MNAEIGHCRWAIAEGYIPGQSVSQEHALVSHEACCMLNATEREADIEIMLYFEDRGPVGPHRVKLGAQRTLHLRFKDLTNPEPVPRDTSHSSVVVSTVPIVVQHTRLDSRHPTSLCCQRPRITRTEPAAISSRLAGKALARLHFGQ